MVGKLLSVYGTWPAMVVCCTGVSVENPVLEDMYEYVYTEFMEEIDAVDNGISDRDGEPR